eukprot:4852452-Amphidinium_carterae.2
MGDSPCSSAGLRLSFAGSMIVTGTSSSARSSFPCLCTSHFLPRPVRIKALTYLAQPGEDLAIMEVAPWKEDSGGGDATALGHCDAQVSPYMIHEMPAARATALRAIGQLVLSLATQMRKQLQEICMRAELHTCTLYRM